jgi:REase_DpnII-MboI
MTRDRLGKRTWSMSSSFDKAHYRKHPDCKTLVCFVYDPDHRLLNPTRSRATSAETRMA